MQIPDGGMKTMPYCRFLDKVILWPYSNTLSLWKLWKPGGDCRESPSDHCVRLSGNPELGTFPISTSQLALAVLGFQTYTTESIFHMGSRYLDSAHQACRRNSFTSYISSLPHLWILPQAIGVSEFSFQISELFRGMRLSINQDLENTWSTVLLCKHPLLLHFHRWNYAKLHPEL